MSKTELNQEFKRQAECLLQFNFHQALNISEEQFLKIILPLKEKLTNLNLPAINLKEGHLPFVIVIKSPSITAEEAMSRVIKNNIKGVANLRPLKADDFKTIEDINIPEGPAYLLIDIDRGKGTLNIPPSEAINNINKAGRSPLTINEGVTIATLFPEFLIKNNCFSLLGSRTGKDKRVPAIWINAKKEANLGWCWNGNPHTWLGSASTATRT